MPGVDNDKNTRAFKQPTTMTFRSRILVVINIPAISELHATLAAS